MSQNKCNLILLEHIVYTICIKGSVDTHTERWIIDAVHNSSN